MLFGIPAPYVLVLFGVAAVFGLGGMSQSKTVGISVLCIVGATWLGLAFVCGQDRARVPVMLLRLRYKFAKRIDSYSSSGLKVHTEED